MTTSHTPVSMTSSTIGSITIPIAGGEIAAMVVLLLVFATLIVAISSYVCKCQWKVETVNPAPDTHDGPVFVVAHAPVMEVVSNVQF